MMDISFWGAALAGLLSFLSPCVLPMVPFYLAYMAGTSVKDLQADGRITRSARVRLVGQAALFAMGVTTIFMLLGLGATSLGQLFLQWHEVLSWIAGGALILFGLHFLGLLRIGLFYREIRLQAQPKATTVLGAYAMGLAFGFGWTPCVGPALAAILMVASTMGDPLRGGMLLAVYGLAMTLPFVIAAGFAAPVLAWLGRHRAMMGYVEKVMGAMLILFGLLIATNSVNVIAAWMIQNFDWTLTLR